MYMSIFLCMYLTEEIERDLATWFHIGNQWEKAVRELIIRSCGSWTTIVSTKLLCKKCPQVQHPKPK